VASVADYDVRAAFGAIEEELIASMMRNLAHHRAQETAEGIKWSQWQVEQLAALERYKKRNRKRFGGLFSGINARIERAIAVQRAAGQAGQELSILQAAKTGAKIDRAAKQAALEGSFHDINDRKFNALLRATTQDMEKAEHAILRRANDAYRKVIFNAQVYANTGAGTYEKAVDMATRDFLRSGIQCVVYKDGSRHSLADYADMALRTASKRAYLQGEGEQRQAWGISTVIVNKRGGACPKCARFCGKVFIDDVWSGGKAEDGDYPLLSSAIQMGLYHPRCKDAHSTFFPGVTEVDQPWTPAELEQLERTEQRQQRQQHAQRQAERYDRLARYSLDEGNRERYRARKQAWEEMAPVQLSDYLVQAQEALRKAETEYAAGAMTMNAVDDIISETDRTAIFDYMSSGVAYALNDALRSGRELTPEQQNYKRNLDIALAKLPDYSGTLYRSLTSDFMDMDEFRAAHQVGNIVRYPAFTSSSKEIYDDTMDIQMVIQAKHGKDISLLNPQEKEVLFRRGSQFVVTKIENGVIYMEELP